MSVFRNAAPQIKINHSKNQWLQKKYFDHVENRKNSINKLEPKNYNKEPKK